VAPSSLEGIQSIIIGVFTPPKQKVPLAQACGCKGNVTTCALVGFLVAFNFNNNACLAASTSYASISPHTPKLTKPNVMSGCNVNVPSKQ
jgi:hypothetical protein